MATAPTLKVDEVNSPWEFDSTPLPPEGEYIMDTYDSICYDLYVDNCFTQRIWYFGLLQILEKQWKDKGHVVRVETKRNPVL